jgi:predicted alpha/beta-hydrolase family hydrolase
VLTVRRPATPPRAVVLLLHGGQARSHRRTRPWNGAVLRMIPFGWALARYDGVVIARLRHRVRGWNGRERSPVAEARWALADLRARFPEQPIVLIGHSMGGRTALAVADEPRVRAVVALAPWIEQYDRVEPVTGRRLLIVHGEHDRITNPAASAAFAARARTVTGVSYVSVHGSEHAMLRRARLWHELAATFTAVTVLDQPPLGTPDVRNVVGRALAGEASLVV